MNSSLKQFAQVWHSLPFVKRSIKGTWSLLLPRWADSTTLISRRDLGAAFGQNRR